MLEVLILGIAVIVGAAICSISEAAILSLPLVRARILYEQNRPNSRDVLYLKENIGMTVASIVIVNNTITIVGSMFIGEKITEQFGDAWLGIASTITTMAIILIGEIVPKAIGEKYKISLSLFFAKFLRVLLWLFRPIVQIVIRITQPFEKDPKLGKVTEEEIKMMLKLGRDSGTVELDEEVLCNRVFKLNDLKAEQIMHSLDNAFALPAEKTLGELKDLLINSEYSRIVVYGKDPHDIVGLSQQRVLLREVAKDNLSGLVKDFMEKPIFVNGQMKADLLLEKFLAYNQHLFIVDNNQGKHIGLITMEDVLEELFGEIYDEKDIKLKKGK